MTATVVGSSHMASTTNYSLGMPWALPPRNAPHTPRAVGPPLPPVEYPSPFGDRIRGGQLMLLWQAALKADTPEEGAERLFTLLAHQIMQASQSQGHVQQLAADLRQNARTLSRMVVP
jgi:hypothetical protein